MTITEAAAVNVVCSALLGPYASYRQAPTEDELVSALSTLAERANKALQAGFSGGLVVARRDRMRLKLRRK